jgi:hypothetical protein
VSSRGGGHEHAVLWVRHYQNVFVAFDKHGKSRGRYVTQLRAMRALSRRGKQHRARRNPRNIRRKLKCKNYQIKPNPSATPTV